MRSRPIFAAALLVTTSLAVAQPTSIDSRIDRVSLFKNGLAVIERTIELPGPGEYRLQNIAPVHGTFFLDSPTPVTVRTTEELAPAKPSERGIDTQSLAGSEVEVVLKSTPDKPITGTVVGPSTDAPLSDNNRGFVDPRYTIYWNNPAATPPPQPMFCLAGPVGAQTFIAREDIARIRVLKPAVDAPRTQRKSVMMLTVPPASAAQTVRVSYLASGLSWAPSYRFRAGADNKLDIEQVALIRNENEDFTGADVQLVTGFPNIRFKDVLSPMAAGSTWARFAAEMAIDPNDPNYNSRQMAMNQQALSNSPGSSALPDGIPGTAEPIDVYYHSVGKHDLKKWETLTLAVASASTTCTREVTWTIPDLRDEYGRVQQSNDHPRGNPYGRPQATEDPSNPAAWDSLVFANPFDFPMTTAPASVFIEGRFAGQSISKFTSSKEQTILPVNKALSVRTRSQEVDGFDAGQQPQREVVSVFGRDYYKTKVSGTLTLTNSRKTPAVVRLTRQYSGQLVSASLDPIDEGREGSDWSVNPRKQLTWVLTIEPGETAELEYQYQVFIAR
jgi:hypothetical protein